MADRKLLKFNKHDARKKLAALLAEHVTGGKDFYGKRTIRIQ